MQSSIRTLFLYRALVGALCFAGCAGNGQSASPKTAPQTWTVTAGSSTDKQAYQALLFYPSAITVNAGDTVTWTSPSGEPHTISFPATGATPVPPTDPKASDPAGGSSYDGTSFVSSGFILLGKSYSLTFPKPGTYAYYSIPQEPFVVGTVVVQPAGSSYPKSPNQYAAAAQASITADLNAARKSVAFVPFSSGSNLIAAGIAPAASGPANSTVMRFLDAPTESDNLVTTIKVGTTITFENLSNNVPHTVTFPALGATPPPGPPFQPPTGGTTYDGTFLVNSGVIPPGGKFSLKFTAPGRFPYHCLFHDDTENMIATVVVTP